MTIRSHVSSHDDSPGGAKADPAGSPGAADRARSPGRVDANPAGADAAFVQAPVRWLDETGSTNRDALEWARDGAPHGSAVVAAFQTFGRGRMGRSWLSASGQNLLVSFVVRPAADTLMPLRAGVACARTVEEVAPDLAVRLKWPNDVRVGHRKLAGILVESTSVPDERVAVIGFGINLNQSAFPGHLDDQATSMLLETGQRQDRRIWMKMLRRNLAEALSMPDPVRAFEDRMALKGEQVTIHREAHGQPARAMRIPQEPVPGTDAVKGEVEGVGPDGALILLTEEGRRTFYAGDISFHGN